MKWFFQTVLLGVLAVGMNPVLAGEKTDTSSMPFRVARVLRSSIRATEQKLDDLLQRQEVLPPLTPGRQGESVGFHSRFQESATNPLDILIDLGEDCSFDRIALFPVSSVFQGEAIAGYGFPLHFTIEAASNSNFTDAVQICDWTASDESVRPEYPVQVSARNQSARYLRLRILEHWQRSDGRYLSALGEMMVLSGGRNIAMGGTVEADSFISLPDWSSPNLIDGQTDLGLPIKPEPSLGNGFMTRGSPVPETNRWMQIELPQPVNIREVRLIPTQPLDAPSQYGHGFPRRFRVLASMSTNMASARVIGDYTAVAFPNPGDNPVIIPGDGKRARFIRVEAVELWHITHELYSFLLAELQVYENGFNVALGAAVSVSDASTAQQPAVIEIWKSEFLVDGYSSQNRLIELDEWLDGLAERRMLDLQIAALEARIPQTVAQTMTALLVTGSGFIAVLLSLMGYNKWRRRRMLLEQRREMRTRIARDLHDDLGSRLGGMRLISESLLNDEGLPESMRSDLNLIYRASGDANDAMRDIVWLLDTREGARTKMVKHMRQMASSVLGRMACEFEVEHVPEQELEFEFRRQVLFAYKECLGNIAKHAQASKVCCSIGGTDHRFRFEILDDGKGFELEKVGGGHGLGNLQKRADAIGGFVDIESIPGKGTRVVFDVPVRLAP